MVKRSRILSFFLIIILFASLMGFTSKDILGDVKLGLDLQGGFEVLYEVSPAKEGQEIDQAAMSATAQSLDRRINVLGVSEPNIQIEGDNRIRVQLAGVTDQEQAREMLSTEANLTFRDVDDNVLMDGSDLVEGGASQTFDENGRPSVSIKLKSADKFREVTQEIVNKPAGENLLVIWLDFEEGDSFAEEATKEDPKYLSAPQVSQVFNQDSVSIVGNFTLEEAKTLSDLLSAGSLPVKLDEVYSTSVGAQFGESALDKTIIGGIIGIAAIFIFMIAYYRLPGVIAVITLSVYLYLTLVVFNMMNAVLTLPGVAALILGVGMAVDANIITYERIKDEIRVGRSIKAAFKAGSKNSLSTIFDANLTTLLAAGVLFIYGTSSVKGFATTLILSILMSFITAVYGARLLLWLCVNSNLFKNMPGMFGVHKKDIHQLNENLDTVDLTTKFDRFDFVKHRKKYYSFSGLMVVLGIIVLFIFGLNLSIDFSQGTRIEQMSNEPLTEEGYQASLAEIGIETDDIVISGNNNEIGVARIKDEVFNKEQIAEYQSQLEDEYGSIPNISTVTPTVGKEIAMNAIKALAIAAIGIILYVTIRFEWRMALAAVLALLHDAFFIVVIFSVTRLEADLTFIAAVLTIVGYSINDTIVTFDRIRENMVRKKKIKTFDELAQIANQSLRQTLGRSINTIITVVLAVLALLIFGSEAIRNFNIALLIGLIAGTYSSIFLATQMWLSWKGVQLKKHGVLITYKEKKQKTDEPQV
ncbi:MULTISPECIES: protein translocase subunit SecDF [Cytobacillus]|uniref:protein translocase subunit SecDF n=1 Tax=Cytobacillus TaxID=2675230 RepID=UPI00203B4AB4|nr:protein translocase subunit SecDF [Cytobacillus kochii]MCM3323258.1 protein translocase subunit SecDF [Cytobacillus kochii]MCM3345653.1 protein translocase subunit SecDF [Cytobacillus kochii]MDM5208605.1 protein translocase subunit SecDF [Cytobacillus kochii]